MAHHSRTIYPVDILRDPVFWPVYDEVEHFQAVNRRGVVSMRLSFDPSTWHVDDLGWTLGVCVVYKYGLHGGGYPLKIHLPMKGLGLSRSEDAARLREALGDYLEAHYCEAVKSSQSERQLISELKDELAREGRI